MRGSTAHIVGIAALAEVHAEFGRCARVVQQPLQQIHLLVLLFE
jgi:hypothetical protein